MKYTLVLLVMAIFGLTAEAFAQNKKDAKTARIKSAINDRSYVFHAQTALPSGGRSRQLTSSYTFRIAGDSVISDLPYFGRAYSAPIDPTKSALQFTSAKASYTVDQRKKGGWGVTIKFNDVQEVQQAYLTISEAGYASLNVTPTNRQVISFNGYVDKN